MDVGGTKSLRIMLVLLAIGFILGVSSIETKADVVLNNSVSLKPKTTNFKTTNVIKVPDRSAERRRRAEVEARRRASRGLTTAARYSDKRILKGSGNSIVNYAYKFLGRPYVWGAAGPRSFDCSGFVQYVYRHFGIHLPHYTGYQVQRGVAVAKSDLKAGDLVFFHTYSSFSHVGIYIGNGKFIQASSGSHKVIISNLNGSYYKKHYAGARRIVK
ncbi:murein DD-endopeptidase MepH precursor [Clostridium tepidiprofundi DSM 19306]|uniref:Murein DD-endopeptidase MepH n=1 Tax=Clostridium tepidiprofundi DSM 19306 TaxID=1121338 RepID=A0A151B3V2_9CLOT|nr:C40 family peptidase [Clostridium tepidiprofundi]KYH34473.1 murein DD-endopeptidase MepH precursor [Clostridium tepidiprofundi DSM 19306]